MPSASHRGARFWSLFCEIGVFAMGYRRGGGRAKVGKRVPARYGGTCAATGARYESGTEIVKTASGWVLASHYDTVGTSEPASTPGVFGGVSGPSGGRVVSPAAFAGDNLAPGCVVREFDSIADLFERAESPAPSWALAAHSRSSSSSFTLTDNFEAAQTLARTGWSEGRASLQAMTAAISAQVRRVVKSPVPVADVCGDCFDVGMAISGVPEHWFNFEMQDTDRVGGNVIRLHVMSGYLGNVSTSAIMRRGAAVVALAHTLEYCGYPVEIFMSSAVSVGGSGGRAKLVYRCPVKHSSEPVEIDRLAFIFAHASFHRRYVFSLREREAVETQRGITDCGYGSSCDAPLPGDSVFLPALHSDGVWRSDASAVAWVLEELQRQGVQLETE